MRVVVGERLIVDERMHVVTAIWANTVLMRDAETGQRCEYAISELARDPQIRLDTSTPGTVLDLPFPMEELSGAQQAQLAYWSEVIGDLVRALDAADYRERGRIYQQTLDRVRADGRIVSMRTLRRKADRFRAGGRAALLDPRLGGRPGGGYVWDPRVTSALLETMAAETNEPTGTGSRLFWRTEQRLENTYGPGVVTIPSHQTMYRMLKQLDPRGITTGPASRRQQVANTPDRPYSARGAFAPGEQVQIDTTRLNIRVRLENKVVDRPELTIMLDVASRSILAAVLRPHSTKSTDLLLALARALVPFDRRLDGADRTRELVEGSFTRPMLPVAELDEQRRRVPVITPRAFTTDLGRVFTSTHFMAACEQLGISVVRAAPRTPTDKGKVETTFRTINTLFSQYCAGYVGHSVEHHGVEDPERPLHSLQQVQALLDEWVAVVWQNRPHGGLRDPLLPSVKLSPNQMVEAYRTLVPELEIPFDTETYIRLLPIQWRRVQRYGITIDNRTYDSPELRPLRGRRSSDDRHNGRWAFRVDPYNVQTVWLEADSRLIPMEWTGGRNIGPMSMDVWKAARAAGDRRRGSIEEAARMRAMKQIRQDSQEVVPPAVLARSDAAQPLRPHELTYPEHQALEALPDAHAAEEPKRSKHPAEFALLADGDSDEGTAAPHAAKIAAAPRLPLLEDEW
ncbi:MAG: Mu transposase C-terminal domain-containing protein [Leifsonia sp.]